MKLLRKIRYHILNMREKRAMEKMQACCACRYFNWFHGSAGVCESPARVGCCTTRMKNYSDSCDCGNFKKRRGSNR